LDETRISGMASFESTPSEHCVSAPNVAEYEGRH
jgi:hypothetical protein